MNTFHKPFKKDISIYFKNKLHKRLFYTDSSINNYKIVGKTRHFPFATKEWKDSVYTYNKNSLKVMSVKDKLISDFFKSYFTINNNNIARSRRMRSLILRSSSKGIILSKPEIKQTNDKINITIYNYNREKQILVRKLYFFKKKHNFHNIWLNNRNNKKILSRKLINPKKVKHIMKHTLFSKKSFKKSKMLNKRIPYNNISFKNETSFLRFRLMNLYKKFFVLNNNFLFLFLKHLLLLFKVELFLPLMRNNKINNLRIKNILRNKPKLLILLNNNNLKLIKNDDINLENLNLISYEQKYSYYKSKPDHEKLNNFLWYFIRTRLIDSKIVQNRQISLLFVKLKNEYFNKIIAKYFRRKIKVLKYLTKLEINKLKFSVLLNNLKNIIAKIYDKKAELNLVNLKYFHLDSDIYSEIVAKKLTKKVNALKVLRYSFKSVKLPSKLLLRSKNDNNINNFRILSRHKSVKLTDLNFDKSESSYGLTDKSGILNYILYKLFPNSAIHIRQNIKSFVKSVNGHTNSYENKLDGNNKIENILNTVKYKWIKGIKVAMAGRLTRRNTAAKALKKYITKGNLNDTQYYLESNELKNLSKVMLRNNAKANLQYTSSKSKRRTGAFGIKSWISSY